jgi:golgi phosphoprotein 3
MFSLAEELLLLALDETKGTTRMNTAQALPYGLAGALLTDLAVMERISIWLDDVLVFDSSPTGDPLLDEALTIIARENEILEVRHWVNALARDIKRLRERVRDRLVARGILAHETTRVLRVFTRHRYPAVDPTPARTLRGRLRTALLTDDEPEDRTLALISLAGTCRVLEPLFTAAEVREARQRARALTARHRIGGATGSAAAMAAAAASGADAAVVAAVVAASSVSCD